MTVLCLASYFKGLDFIRECRRQGCRVLLLTSHSLASAEWPRESIDETFYIPDVDKKWKIEDVLLGVSYMARSENIDRIVPLDDFDVETAATLREHLRMPGMGDTTARYFRDKLAMRTKARDEGLAVPDFIHILNYPEAAGISRSRAASVGAEAALVRRLDRHQEDSFRRRALGCARTAGRSAVVLPA